MKLLSKIKRSVVDSIARNVEDFSTHFSRVLRVTGDRYCPIAGQAESDVFFTDDNMLVSVLQITGSGAFVSADELADQLDLVDESFSTLLRELNTDISIVYQTSTEHTRHLLERHYAPLHQKVEHLGLRHLHYILKDRLRAQLPHISEISVYLVVATRAMSLITKEERAEHRQERKAGNADYEEIFPDAMRAYYDPDAVLTKHRSTLGLVRTSLDNLRIGSLVLEGHAVALLWRSMLGESVDNWQARLPGDDRDTRVYNIDPFLNNQLDAKLYPTLGRQLFSSSMSYSKQYPEIARIGNRYVGSLFVNMLPLKEAKPFHHLLNNFAERQAPFRISITFSGGNEYWQNMVSLRRGLGYLVLITSMGVSSNGKLVAKAAENLTELFEKGAQACGVSILASTWGSTEKEAIHRTRMLQRALQGWGKMQVEAEQGDALLAYTASLPGWHSNLRQAIGTYTRKMMPGLPLNLVTSPWSAGSHLYVTRQGLPFPYQPMSNLQHQSNFIVVGPTGAGKSVWLSGFVLDAITDPLSLALPRICYIDIDYSAQGMVELVQADAPPHIKDRVLHIEFELSDRFGTNIMDLRTGCDKPLTQERGFIQRFLTLIFTPIGEGAQPPDKASGIASSLINEAYRMAREADLVQIYDPSLAPTVAQWLATQADWLPTQKTTWWSVVHFAIERNRFDIAASAQRFAVPTLSMLPRVLKRSRTLQETYGDGELKPFETMLFEFIEQYPSLCRPSSYVAPEVDIAVIELSKVTKDTGPDGVRRTTIAYMMARYLFGKDLMLFPEVLDEMPTAAQAYYRPRIDALSTQNKFLIYDELNRTKKDPSTRAQILDDQKMARKFNLSVGLASQDFTDFDDAMIAQASLKVILRTQSAVDAEALGKHFDWPPIIRKSLYTEVRGAQGDFANMLFSASALKGTDFPECTQIVKSIRGRAELSAFSTTPADRALRKRVVAAGIAPLEANILIGQLFPSGVKKAVEQFMREHRFDQTGTSMAEDDEQMIQSAITPFFDQVMTTYREYKAANKDILQNA